MSPDGRDIPAWIDEALKKAVHADRSKRYAQLSEFTYDLRHPNRDLVNSARPPLIERNPVLLWKLVSLGLAAAVCYLLYLRATGRR